MGWDWWGMSIPLPSSLKDTSDPAADTHTRTHTHTHTHTHRYIQVSEEVLREKPGCLSLPFCSQHHTDYLTGMCIRSRKQHLVLH